MTILVDELRQWGAINASGKFRWRYSCHLTTDGGLNELHRFAQGIGLRREWFQSHPKHPHYDLTRTKREKAIEHGAVFKPAIQQARERMRAWQRGELAMDIQMATKGYRCSVCGQADTTMHSIDGKWFCTIHANYNPNPTGYAPDILTGDTEKEQLQAELTALRSRLAEAERACVLLTNQHSAMCQALKGERMSFSMLNDELTQAEVDLRECARCLAAVCEWCSTLDTDDDDSFVPTLDAARAWLAAHFVLFASGMMDSTARKVVRLMAG